MTKSGQDQNNFAATLGLFRPHSTPFCCLPQKVGAFTDCLTPVSSFEANTMPPPDFDSRQARRERAYMWHRRWAMPTYEMMKYQVRIAPGLDITEEDVDLLPWAHNRGNKKNLDNAEYHRLQGAELRAFAY